MTPKKRRSRVYWPTRGGVRRAYGDSRDYVDVGGHREALVAPGERVATSDPDIADALAAARLRELDGLRRGRALHGHAQGTPLAAYAAAHLELKARAGKVTRDWMAMAELFLLNDWRKTLDRIAVRAGVDAGRGAFEGVPPHLLRGAAPDARGRRPGEPIHGVA